MTGPRAPHVFELEYWSALQKVDAPEITAENCLTCELEPWHAESWVAEVMAAAITEQQVAQEHFDMARGWLDEGERALATRAQQLAAHRYAEARDCVSIAMTVSRRLKKSAGFP